MFEQKAALVAAHPEARHLEVPPPPTCRRRRSTPAQCGITRSAGGSRVARPRPTTTREDGAVTSVFCFLLSALSLVWVLVVISPQTYRPLMLLIGVWAIFRAKPTAGRWGPAIDTLWVDRARFRRCSGRSPTASRSVPHRESDRRRRALRRARDRRHSRSRAADDRLDSAGRRRWCSSSTRLPDRGWPSIGLGGIAHRGYDLPRLVGNLYMTLEGIYGVPLDVAVTYIILFSLYGAVLEKSGAGTFFLDFAMSFSSGRNPAAATGRSVTLAGFLLGHGVRAAASRRRSRSDRSRGRS